MNHHQRLAFLKRLKDYDFKFIPLAEIPEKYKKYDDRGVLLLDNSYIANDYKKPFAVSRSPLLNGLLEFGYQIVQDREYVAEIDGKPQFKRALVQKT